MTFFDSLKEKRDRVGKNADFKDFRDYKFAQMGRFDYGSKECLEFHQSIKKEILPLVKDLQEDRKAKLNLDVLRPWDLDVDVTGKAPLKPFEKGSELIEKTINIFNQLRPYYGECLSIMREMGNLDLESKDGKSPGGYNYPLYEVGVPFIFMNAVGTHSDVVTMVHEGGHAIHSFLTRDLELTSFKSFPSEVAELASMAMELLSMNHWDVFYSDPDELRRAKKEQMQRVLGIFPWVALVDNFQHWLYTNPKHTAIERSAKWNELQKEFGTGVVSWEGFEDNFKVSWQKQMHIFEVPFYYVEYAMAQLGAIAVWKNYMEDPKKALDQYEAALKLGYTKSIPEIYEAAGIKFDFSREYLKELTDFVRGEMEKL